jgi:hypothetical protein
MDTTRKEPEKAPHFSGPEPDLQKIFPGFGADKEYMLSTTNQTRPALLQTFEMTDARPGT